MKTNVVMPRNIGGLEFYQRTKDSFFEANSLLSKWNSKPSNPKREMKRFLSSPKTIEFINEIESNSHIAEMRFAGNKAFVTTKGRNTSKGKTKDKVWMHPYLFIDFALWLNPRFKLEVIKFVYDQLIENRHAAGDNYKMLSTSGSKLKGYDYVTVAKALQWIVFNKTGKELRQKATQEQLKELKDIQLKLSYAIDMGFITNFQQLMEQLRTLYEIKYNGFKVALN